MDEWTGRGQGPAVPRYGKEIRCYYGSVCMRCRVAARVNEDLFCGAGAGPRNPRQTVELVPVCISCAPVQMGQGHNGDVRPS